MSASRIRIVGVCVLNVGVKNVERIQENTCVIEDTINSLAPHPKKSNLMLILNECA